VVPRCGRRRRRSVVVGRHCPEAPSLRRRGVRPSQQCWTPAPGSAQSSSLSSQARF